MQIKTTINWQGPGWYTIVRQNSKERFIEPHKIAFRFTGSSSLVCDGKNSHFRFRRKPGAYEARKYWSGEGICVLNTHQFNELWGDDDE